ncbi:carbamoyl-phosphate synthase large subunit [Trueperella bonasi]|uniref:Carbamoyl-phosphate synthase large subunit n=1 Tax=Trueperella bonasi TaxID=312286 RepID=A0ABT9NFX6_9ACTO|nr:ATP-grasp domain-containing protein [Trueperella bonasi]MDP9806301.1 carbamoyl-phosphate synthase large subunit [Trueperella bonasi]
MKILVTGAAGPAGRALVPQLIERGVEVVQVDMAGAEGIHQVPAAGEDTFVRAIWDLVLEENIDAIIPTVQEELPVFAKASRFAPVLISSPLAIDVADDKWLTYHQLNRCGVNVPKSTTPESIDTATLLWMGSPVISKPRKSRGGRGVLVHENPHAHELATLPEDSIIQEFASGVEYAPNVFVSDERIECVVLKKTELAHGLHGNAVSTVVVDEPEIAQLAIDAARAIGVTGPADVDIRRLADGTPVVLEINARFGANSAKAPIIVEAVLDAFKNDAALFRANPADGELADGNSADSEAVAS